MEKKREYKITFHSFVGHLHTVNKHRFKVLCLCCKVGIPIQGLLHDLSKYSPTEFWEGVKYFEGTYSPIKNCKEENGYSNAWIHHKGRNKHHYEYWYDYYGPIIAPVMPFNYFVEYLCDSYAAGMVYQGKKWSEAYQLSYWNRTKEHAVIDPRFKKLLDKVYQEGNEKGINTILKKKYLKKLYEEYIT